MKRGMKRLLRNMEPGDDEMTVILMLLGIISLATLLYISCKR